MTLHVDMKAQLIQQSGDNARLKIRERELQQEVRNRPLTIRICFFFIINFSVYLLKQLNVGSLNSVCTAFVDQCITVRAGRRVNSKWHVVEFIANRSD